MRRPLTTQSLLPMSSWRVLRSIADGPAAASSAAAAPAWPRYAGAISSGVNRIGSRKALYSSRMLESMSDRSIAGSGVSSGSPPWKYSTVLHAVRAHHAHGLRHVQFLADVAEQAVVPRDDVGRRPRLRRDAEHLELDRQLRRVLHRLGDGGVHPVHVGGDDRLAVRVVPVQLGGQVAAEHVQARADVALQLPPPENLGHRAGGLPPPHLELEQPIARRRVALREEQVGFALRVDVVDAPPVAQDLDRLAEAADTQGRGGWSSRPGGGDPPGRDQNEDERGQSGQGDTSHGAHCRLGTFLSASPSRIAQLPDLRRFAGGRRVGTLRIPGTDTIGDRQGGTG